MVAAAVIGSAVVGAAGSAYASSQSKKAAKGQAAATENATQAQLNMYNQTRDDLSPYTQAGVNATNSLSGLLGLNGESSTAALQQDPSYQFRLNQGLDSVQSSAAGQGSLLSGATLKALNNYASDYASAEYGNAYNRLLGASQLGENAAAQVGNTGTSVAQSVANNTMAGANATAAGQVASANTWSNYANSLGSLATAYGTMKSNGSI